MHSDTQNGIVYDPLQKRYLMYCRAKHVYRTFQGEIVDTGESRRIALLTNKELWDPWTGDPQNIIVPDDADYADERFNAFYGMPVRFYGGVFWGGLWRFRFNDEIHTRLAFSRDGVRFDRLPERPKFIDHRRRRDVGRRHDRSARWIGSRSATSGGSTTPPPTARTASASATGDRPGEAPQGRVHLDARPRGRRRDGARGRSAGPAAIWWSTPTATGGELRVRVAEAGRKPLRRLELRRLHAVRRPTP